MAQGNPPSGVPAYPSSRQTTPPPGEAYRAAGVDRDAAGAAKERIAELARSTFTSGVLGDIGAFGALFQVSGYRDPVLVSHTDGVGTKLRVAALMGRYDTVGEDLVHHCSNDILTCGARPLFFLDYIGTGSLVPQRVEALVSGMARACRGLGCALVGGETAEMPGLYHGDDLDLVGFIVGAVERDRVVTPDRVREGDLLLGLPSSGLHTNGYSLVRRALAIEEDPSVLGERVPELGATLGEALLVPHRSYAAQLLPLIDSLHAMAHITGGGFAENIPRVLPPGLAAEVETGSWEVPAIFRLVQRRGQVADAEMYRVFNMGIGMVFAVGKGEGPGVMKALPEARAIGRVVAAGAGPRVLLR